MAGRHLFAWWPRRDHSPQRTRPSQIALVPHLRRRHSKKRAPDAYPAKVSGGEQGWLAVTLTPESCSADVPAFAEEIAHHQTVPLSVKPAARGTSATKSIVAPLVGSCPASQDAALVNQTVTQVGELRRRLRRHCVVTGHLASAAR